MLAFHLFDNNLLIFLQLNRSVLYSYCDYIVIILRLLITTNNEEIFNTIKSIHYLFQSH